MVQFTGNSERGWVTKQMIPGENNQGDLVSRSIVQDNWQSLVSQHHEKKGLF